MACMCPLGQLLLRGPSCALIIIGLAARASLSPIMSCLEQKGIKRAFHHVPAAEGVVNSERNLMTALHPRPSLEGRYLYGD